ncbi:MAG: hypothetical protein A4E36_00055 [Methanoregulaceae archaeon PtaB.Bin009]|nr:MAG: hypothetical protein A4E36_00055 [Methanoregulaceae archaeon PtaB.Bin009]
MGMAKARVFPDAVEVVRITLSLARDAAIASHWCV